MEPRKDPRIFDLSTVSWRRSKVCVCLSCGCRVRHGIHRAEKCAKRFHDGAGVTGMRGRIFRTVRAARNGRHVASFGLRFAVSRRARWRQPMTEHIAVFGVEAGYYRITAADVRQCEHARRLHEIEVALGGDTQQPVVPLT